MYFFTAKCNILKIKGLEGLIKSQIKQEKTTQELYAGKLGVSASNIKKMIKDESVVKIDALIALEKEFGVRLIELLERTDEGRKINELVFKKTDEVYFSKDEKVISLLEKQTKLLEQIANK